MILIVTVMVCSLTSGLCVAAVSPIIALSLGIGPQFPVLLPFIAVGNISLVLIWHFVGNIKPGEVWRAVALLVAALTKFAVLRTFAAGIAIPLLLPNAPPALSEIFSFPQFVTATIGGAFALSVIPALKRIKGNP
jgi:hypothetical protein